MTWLERVPDEFKVRAQVARMTDPEAKVYVTAGPVVSVGRVARGSGERCEIVFQDRAYLGDGTDLVDTTIITDFLGGSHWTAEVARRIEALATEAIGERVRLWQLNEHSEHETSDKGFRRVVWLERGRRPA